MSRTAPRLTVGLGAAVCSALGMALGLLLMMLPDRTGTHILSSFGSPVSVKFDNFGVPHIVARDRNDAFVALGYVTSRDRLFQLDLLRRKSAGRLSEIFGAALIKDDRWARTMGFPRLAQLVFSRLPQEQRNALSAYAEGVNHAMRDAWAPPWEFIVLGYRPEPWTVEDSILVAFNLSGLSYTEGQERMATAMRASLPEDVFRFLTPDSDCFNEKLAASGDADRCASKAPVDSLAGLVSNFSPRPNALTTSRAVAKGSNAWVIASRKFVDLVERQRKYMNTKIFCG